MQVLNNLLIMKSTSFQGQYLPDQGDLVIQGYRDERKVLKSVKEGTLKMLLK